MPADPRQSSSPARSLGSDIRALRKRRGMTLQALASIMNRSVGWLSQVERDLSMPSAVDLNLLAGALNVAPASLFGGIAPPPHEAGRIVRAGARRPVGPWREGLVEELLSPDLTDTFEVVHSTFLPGAKITDAAQRGTQEVGYLVSGRLRVEIGGAWFELQAGDSFRLRGEPFRWDNPFDVPAVAVWVIAPPIY